MADGESENPALSDTGTDLWDTLVGYARQETVDPLRGLGRFIAYGVGGSVLMAFGLAMLVLSGLRALQTETGSRFTGSWSWAPYLIALVLTGIIIAIAVKAISRETRKREKAQRS